MKAFWAAAAAWARAFAGALCAGVLVVVSQGRLPSTKADLVIVGASALGAFVPVISRALNPADPAYGVGAMPR